ncbi:MAG: hypothetical protein GYA62_08890 [Bacteroidales bacterium]|nr:hypothetical protein [Bacteroidales bacterium]
MRLLMIIIICLSVLKTLIAEEIEQIKKEAWNKLNDTEQFTLCNDLIKLSNKLYKEYIETKNKNEKLEEKIKKEIKKNLISFKIGYGVNLKLEQNIFIDFSYFRFFKVFGVGGGVGNVINLNDVKNTIFYINLNLSLSF